MSKKFIYNLIFFLLFINILTGCSTIAVHSENLMKSRLKNNDITRFIHNDNEYIILNDTYNPEQLGQKISSIDQIRVVNLKGHILTSEPFDQHLLTYLDTMNKLNTEHSQFILTYYNVYLPLENNTNLIVDINGSYHKAILADTITQEDVIFTFILPGTIDDPERTMLIGPLHDAFKLNPINPTQIIFDNTIYQITTEQVLPEDLDEFLSAFYEKIKLSVDNTQILEQAGFFDIEWIHTAAQATWFYGDIFKINNVDPNVSFAVKVNNNYYKVAK